MPRPIFRVPQKESVNKTEQETNPFLNTRQPVQKAPMQKQISKMEMDRLLRKPRSGAYMEAVCSLDSGAHAHNRHRTEEILHAIAEEFPQVEIAEVLLGIVSRCYLGAPYEVHCLDISGSIIEHYKRGESMPGGLEKARGIALCGSYEVVEVYIDCCRAVSTNGAVSVIR